MTTHRAFDVEIANVEASATTFAIGDRTFTRSAEVPLGALLGIADLTKETDNFRRATRYVDFVASWLVPEDRDDWREVVKTFPRLSILDEVAAWLIESLSPVPTSAHSSSAESAQPNGTSTPDDGAGSTVTRSPKSKRASASR